MKRLQLLVKYLKYYFTSKGRHGIHSPFVYKLNEEVFQDKRHFYAFDEIERLRKTLEKTNKTIEVCDFGAGSLVSNTKKKKVKIIAGNAAVAPKYGKLLFRLVDHFKPKAMLEIGTSLGISTTYQAKAAPDAQFITLEGCPQTAAIAKENFNTLNLQNVTLKVGEFSQTLPEALQELQKIDFAFIDGNHQKQPTLDYFHKCLPLVHNNSLLIFDDIHWSDEMEAAWEEIKAHPQVTVSVDLFFFGLVFFRKEKKEKEHFVARY